jgi:ABC-type phosphate/phosphonate transport system ATPase subunit
MPQGELVLIRGLPGSGKSTMAKDLATQGYLHFEADMFFEVDGHYRYDASRIRDAHSWCQQMTRQALAKGLKVVVSNTFTQLREMSHTGQWLTVFGWLKPRADGRTRTASQWKCLKRWRCVGSHSEIRQI